VALEERGNVSWRGAYQQFSARFRKSIDDFNCIRAIAEGLAQPGSALYDLPTTVAGRVVTCAYGEGLVPLLDDDGCGGDAAAEAAAVAAVSSDASELSVPAKRLPPAGLGVLGLNFRVMLRKRPLLAWELAAVRPVSI
jgi:hypothetical protein